MTNRTLTYATALLACCGTSLLAQDVSPNVAAWQFTTGETLAYEVKQTTDIDVTAGGAGAFSTSTQQTLDVVWRIDSVDEAGVATGVQTINRIQLEIIMPSGLELSYDSVTDDPPEGIAAMLAPLFETLLENEVAISITPQGKVTQCELPKEMKERLAGIPATRAMSDLVTETGLRRVAEQIALPLPKADEPVSRELTVENRVLGTLSGNLSWNSTPAAEGQTVAKFTPTLSLEVEPATENLDENLRSQPKPLESTAIASQSVTGSSEFDTQSGRLRSLTLNVKLKLTGETLGNQVNSELRQTVEVRGN